MQNSLPNNYKLNTRYTILNQIGQGGFGITYKAHDTLFDRVVCIKELFLSGNSRREESLNITSQSVGDIEFSYFKMKFLQEAQKLANFKHENIVKVFEYFEANNTAYVVLEFVEGENLKDYVKEKKNLDESEALNIFLQLLNATKTIHEKNYLHRDIKPDNVLITPQGKVVLIDFGTAKFYDDKSVNCNTSTLVLLSHGYAPPEQYSNQNRKGKYTDIYALGATFYYMLTGKKPLQATDRTIKELKTVSKINQNVHSKIEQMINKAMELNPSRRFQNVEELERLVKISFNTTHEYLVKEKVIDNSSPLIMEVYQSQKKYIYCYDPIFKTPSSLMPLSIFFIVFDFFCVFIITNLLIGNNMLNDPSINSSILFSFIVLRLFVVIYIWIYSDKINRNLEMAVFGAVILGPIALVFIFNLKRKLLSKNFSSKSKKLKIQELLYATNYLLKNKQIRLAKKFATHAMYLDKGSDLAQFSMAIYYYKTKEFETALKFIKISISGNENNGAKHYFKGLICLGLKQHKLAKTAFLKAIDLNYKNAKLALIKTNRLIKESNS